MRTKISDISFVDFVEVWNDTQGLKTPDVHRKIINFLSSAWDKGDEKALLMAFRGCGKSTMVWIGASVIACIFTGADAKYYLHDLAIMTIDITSEVDTARQQCLQVVDFVVKNNLPSVYIEKNGIGQFLPSLLKSVLAERNVGVAVLEYTAVIQKTVV